MAWFLEDLIPPGRKKPWHPRTAATCLLPEPRRPSPRTQNLGEGRDSAGGVVWAWSREAGPGSPGSAEAGCVLTQHARPGVGQTAGRAAEAPGLVPRVLWPRPWPISTTPTWATFTTVREQGGTRGVSGRGGSEAGATTPGMRTDELSFPTPRGWAPYETPSLGTDT